MLRVTNSVHDTLQFITDKLYLHNTSDMSTHAKYGNRSQIQI